MSIDSGLLLPYGHDSPIVLNWPQASISKFEYDARRFSREITDTYNRHYCTFSDYFLVTHWLIHTYLFLWMIYFIAWSQMTFSKNEKSDWHARQKYVSPSETKNVRTIYFSDGRFFLYFSSISWWYKWHINDEKVPNICGNYRCLVYFGVVTIFRTSWLMAVSAATGL